MTTKSRTRVVQVRTNLWRAFQYIATSPEPTSSHVPGSGTSPPPPPPLPQGFPFPFLPVPPSVTPSFGFFPPTPQTLGSGGGAIGVQPPLPNGSYKLNGGAGPSPGSPGRFSNADWNGAGGLTKAVPVAGCTGSSNFAAGGSDREVACCGISSTRFAQRERAVILPSV